MTRSAVPQTASYVETHTQIRNLCAQFLIGEFSVVGIYKQILEIFDRNYKQENIRVEQARTNFAKDAHRDNSQGELLLM